MKHTSILLLVVLCLFSFSSFGRSKNRHIQGTYGLELSGGLTSYGTALNLGYIQFLRNKKQNRYNLEYDWGNTGTTDYSHLRLSYAYQYSVYDIRSDVFFSIKGGALATYEKQKNDLLDKTNDKITGGIMAGAEVEGFLNNDISIILNAQQYYIAGSKLGKFTAGLTLGVRYVF